MRRAGLSRWRLGKTLRAAYALGLLTDDTFAHRIDDLYGASRVDPQALIGDLTFRTGGGVHAHIRALSASVWPWPRRDGDRRDQLPLLGLDWTGATSEMLIGRSSRCDLVLNDPSVSRRHVHLFFREGRWIVVDLHSTNGTYINGVRVQRSELLPGDQLTIGNDRLHVD